MLSGVRAYTSFRRALCSGRGGRGHLPLLRQGHLPLDRPQRRGGGSLSLGLAPVRRTHRAVLRLQPQDGRAALRDPAARRRARALVRPGGAVERGRMGREAKGCPTLPRDRVRPAQRDAARRRHRTGARLRWAGVRAAGHGRRSQRPLRHRRGRPPEAPCACNAGAAGGRR
ncbi:hypothetical protein D3C72_1752680 [compost metagenome]